MFDEDLFHRVEQTLETLVNGLPDPDTLERAAVAVKPLGAKVHEELIDRMKAAGPSMRELLTTIVTRPDTPRSVYLGIGILIGLKCAELKAKGD